MTSTVSVVQPSVVPIGIFDGVHRGHQLVLEHAVAAARRRDARVVVITFDPHPSTILRPEATPLLITTVERRVAMLEQHGADEVVVLEFNKALSMQPAEEFVKRTLVGRLHAVQIVVGANFRFGHRAKGDVALLRRFDLAVDDVPLLPAVDGEPVSSTFVRDRIAEGDVAAAAAALGRPHFVEGPVIRGDGRGRDLGFPTANLAIDPVIAVPADGVYAGHLVRASGERLPAAISVGSNPTFDGTVRRVEAYALDVDVDLYDEHVAIEFAERLRGMQRFGNVDELISQMALDVQQTRSTVG